MVHVLAFSRDSRLLASGGANGTILIWEVPPLDSLPPFAKKEEAVSLWEALGDSDATAANRVLAALAARRSGRCRSSRTGFVLSAIRWTTSV